MTRVAVVIPSRNGANALACVAAVSALDNGVDIIVVDDGARLTHPDLPVAWVDGVRPFVFARNVNRGIETAFLRGAGVAIILNDDALLATRSGFTMLGEEAVRFPGILSAAVLGATGNARQNPVAQASSLCAIRLEERVLPFIAVAILRPLWSRIGPLDERFVHYGWEDNDYCRRVLDAGGRLGIYDGCVVRHGALPSTFRSGNGAGNVAPNGALYAEKYRGRLLPAEQQFLRANGVQC